MVIMAGKRKYSQDTKFTHAVHARIPKNIYGDFERIPGNPTSKIIDAIKSYINKNKSTDPNITPSPTLKEMLAAAFDGQATLLELYDKYNGKVMAITQQEKTKIKKIIEEATELEKYLEKN